MFVTTGAAGAGGAPTTPAINTTGANLIILIPITSASGITASDLSDSASNVWTSSTVIYNPGSAPGGACGIYALANPTTNAAHTFAYAAAFSVLFVIAVGGSTGLPADQTAQNDSGGTAVTSQISGPITPTQAGELIVTALSVVSAGTGISINGGFTASSLPFTSGQNFGGAMGYLIQGSAATVGPTWSWTGTQASGAAIASFKGSFSGGGGGGGGGAGGGLLLFGGAVGWTPLLRPLPLLGAAAAWKVGKAIRRNATLSRRSLLIGS